MMTRLILVGMVAALGISVPTWPETRGWVMAAHSWTAHQLADWDSNSRRRLEPITLLQAVGRVKRFEPIVVADRASGPDDELNRVAEFADDAPSVAVARRRPGDNSKAKMAPGSESGDFAAAMAIGTPECRWMAELWLSARRPPIVLVSAEIPVIPHRATGRRAPDACIFSPSVPIGPAAPPTIATRVEPRPLPAMPAVSYERIDPLPDARTDVAAELNRSGEGLDIAGPAETRTAAIRRRFDPIDPAGLIDSGLADELNRLSDGVALCGPAVDTDTARTGPTPRPDRPTPAGASIVAERPAPADRSPDVAQAISLTGQAFHAWMRLVAAPADVRLSVR